jgi:hypothetical protein
MSASKDATIRRSIRWSIYIVVFVLLYAASQGPAIYFHNHEIAAGRPGFAKVLNTVYAPTKRIPRWVPFYNAYIGWWCS